MGGDDAPGGARSFSAIRALTLTALRNPSSLDALRGEPSLWR